MTFIFLIWILFSCISKSASISKQYGPPSTFRANTFQFIPSVSTGIINQDMTFPYSSTLPNTGSYRKVLIGVVNIDMDLDQSYQVYFKITYNSNGWDITNCTWNFLDASLLYKFIIRHLIIDTAYTGFFQTVYALYSGNYSGPSNYGFFAYFGVTIDPSKNNQVLAFLNGVDVDSNSSNARFRLSASIYNDTAAYLIINTLDGSRINYFSITLTIFSVQDFTDSGISLGYGSLQTTNGNLIFSSVNSYYSNSFIAGVRSFQFNNYAITFNSFLSSSNFSISGVKIIQLSFYYFVAFTSCPPNYQYFSQVDGLCYDSCPVRTYQKSNLKSCSPCQYRCYNCDNSATCLDCSIDDHRTFSSDYCIPSPGYYQSNLTVAYKCSFPCYQCQNISTLCLNCVNSSYMYRRALYSCLKCNTIYDNYCQTCDTTSCLSCSFGYLFAPNGINCTLIPCDLIGVMDGCLSCQFGYSDICASCDASIGYQFIPSTKLCNPICGDGKFISGYDQQCDDGNLDNIDGCSSQCKIQDNFQCDIIILPNSYQISDCTYLLPIEIIINSYQRIKDTNNIQFNISLSPLLKVFKNFDFSQIVSTDIPVSDYFFIYDQTNGNLQMTISYTQTIQNTTGLIIIKPLSNGVFRLTPSSNAYSFMQSNTFLPLNYYQDHYYLLGKIISFLGIALSVIAWIGFFIGYYSGQIIGIQMLGIVQFTYLALFSLSQTPTNPCILALSSLCFSNGINIYFLINQNPFSVNILPQIYQELNFYPSFLQNFNLTFLLFIFALIAALIVFILIKNSKQKDTLNDLLIWQRKTLFDFSLSSIIAIEYIVILSTVIQFKYGVFNLKNQLDYISLIYLIVCLIPLIVFFILFYLRPKQFIEFKKFTSLYVVHSQKFYLFVMIQRLLAGIIISSAGSQYALIGIIIIFIIEIIIIAIKKPYARLTDNIRSIINTITQIIISGIICYLALLSSQSYQTQVITFYAPIIIVSLITIVLIYNLIILITYIKWSRQEQLQKKEIQMEIGDLRKLRIQAYENTEITPSPFMFVKEAIEKEKERMMKLHKIQQAAKQKGQGNMNNNNNNDQDIKTVIGEHQNQLKIEVQSTINKFSKQLSQLPIQASVRDKLLDKNEEKKLKMNDDFSFIKENGEKSQKLSLLKKLKQQMAVELTNQQVNQQWDAFTKNIEYQQKTQPQIFIQKKKSTDQLIQKKRKQQDFQSPKNEKSSKNSKTSKNLFKQRYKKSNKKNNKKQKQQQFLQQQIIQVPKVNLLDFQDL